MYGYGIESLLLYTFQLGLFQQKIPWAVVVVKWSVCSPSTLTIPVRIPLKATVFLLHLHFASSRSKCFQYFESFLFRNHSFEYVDGDSLYMTSQERPPLVEVVPLMYIYLPKLVINMATRKQHFYLYVRKSFDRHFSETFSTN